MKSKYYILRLAFVIVISIIFISRLLYEKQCQSPESVSFSGIRINFPLRAIDVKRSVKNVSYGPTDQINTEMLVPGITAKFLFGLDFNIDQKFTDEDLNEADIRAVTFALYRDVNKSDHEILTELKKTFPGTFECIDEKDRSYYIHQEKCMSIILKRNIHHRDGPVPEISFCYHLSKSQSAEYAFRSGNI